ncbi:hypothetical protein BJX99DRAFT_262381 [Aspergillus californicus]
MSPSRSLRRIIDMSSSPRSNICANSMRRPTRFFPFKRPRNNRNEVFMAAALRYIEGTIVCAEMRRLMLRDLAYTSSASLGCCL